MKIIIFLVIVYFIILLLSNKKEKGLGKKFAAGEDSSYGFGRDNTLPNYNYSMGSTDKKIQVKKCEAVTKQGKPCKMNISSNQKYCHIHLEYTPDNQINALPNTTKLLTPKNKNKVSPHKQTKHKKIKNKSSSDEEIAALLKAIGKNPILKKQNTRKETLVFLDTETTGFSGTTDKIIELAIVGHDGKVLFDKLINPKRPIKNSHIHGITDKMVSGLPLFDDYWEEIKSILKGKHIVIFNKNFDTKFFPDHLRCANKVSCAMEQFKASHRGRKYNLKYATEVIGYKWEGKAHRALADTQATRAVWLHMNT